MSHLSNMSGLIKGFEIVMAMLTPIEFKRIFPFISEM